VNVRFTCPECGHPGRCDLESACAWQCPGCEQRLKLAAAPRDQPLTVCAVCNNRDLYRKKDFPHWLGMLLLIVACVAFLITNYLYQQWWAWGILLGSALIDALLYLAVGDVVVCYRCGAQHRGFAVNTAHGPHELNISERYRQERLRREQVEAERRNIG
jgi:hypothetical protein